MKKINLLIVLFVTFLFIGCHAFEPELCHISIKENKNCTYTLEESEVPLYSFFKITVSPKTGYYIHGFSSDNIWERDFPFHKSTDEDNTYYILATEKNLTITIGAYEKQKYYISKANKTEHLNIKPSKRETFEGDTVTFSITPDECFYLVPDTVEVRKKINDNDFEKLNITQSQTDPNEFSFIMPDTEVAIYAETKFAITVSPHKTSFKQGEPIIFDIINHKPQDTFNLELSDCYSDTKKRDYKEIARGIKLSQTYELPYSVITSEYSELNTGRYTLHIYPKDSDYYTTTEATTDFVINLADIPDGWTTIGIKNDESYIWKDSFSESFYLSNTTVKDYTSLTFKYMLKNDKASNTYEGSIITTELNNYNNSCVIKRAGIPLETKALKPYTEMIVWIEDPKLKYISRKVTLNFR